MKAVVLAGGEATRMQPIAKYVPKCLIPLEGIPFLVRNLKKLQHYVDEIVVVTERDKAKAIRYQLNITEINARIISTKTLTSQREKVLLATEANERFLLVFADSFCDADFRSAMKIDKEIVLFVCKEMPVDYGTLEIEDERVIKFKEKKTVEVPFWTGLGIFNRRIFERYKEDEVAKILEHAVKDVEIAAVECSKFYDIGNISSYKRTLKMIK